MQVDVVETYTEFEKLKLKWDVVYEADPEAQFFLSWDWLAQVFLQHEKGWFILAARVDDTDNDYIAFFPLRIKTQVSKSTQAFYNVISVAGRYTWSDYAGFICHPDHQDKAIPSLASKLIQMHWLKVYLKNLLISKQRLKLFTDQFNKETFSHRYRKRIGKSDNINLLICPRVDLPDDYETYLTRNLSANSRQKARRYLRKLEDSDELYITHASEKTYQRDVGFLIDFWNDKWEERKGKETSELARKYREILDLGFKCDALFMPVLWAADKPLGVLGIFVDHRKQQLLYFIAGRDEHCNNPPPGFILHAYSIRWAIENGFKHYDFLRGDESFKYSFGATDREIHYLVISTRSRRNLNGTLDPRSLDEALNKATRYQNSGRVDEAKIGFQQILDVDPDNDTALRRLGRLVYQQHKSKESGNK